MYDQEDPARLELNDWVLVVMNWEGYECEVSCPSFSGTVGRSACGDSGKSSIMIGLLWLESWYWNSRKDKWKSCSVDCDVRLVYVESWQLLVIPLEHRVLLYDKLLGTVATRSGFCWFVSSWSVCWRSRLPHRFCVALELGVVSVVTWTLRITIIGLQKIPC